jgi:hypothetical protein
MCMHITQIHQAILVAEDVTKTVTRKNAHGQQELLQVDHFKASTPKRARNRPWRTVASFSILSAYTRPLSVTISVYLSNACHYRRIFVQCLSLSAYIFPMPVTIGVYLSNACYYRRIFCASLGKRAPCICICIHIYIYTCMYHSLWALISCKSVWQLFSFRKICRLAENATCKQ